MSRMNDELIQEEFMHECFLLRQSLNPASHLFMVEDLDEYNSYMLEPEPYFWGLVVLRSCEDRKSGKRFRAGHLFVMSRSLTRVKDFWLCLPRRYRFGLIEIHLGLQPKPNDTTRWVKGVSYAIGL